MTLSSSFLCDNERVVGRNLKDFEVALETIDQCTFVESRALRDISILSYLNEDDTSVFITQLNPGFDLREYFIDPSNSKVTKRKFAKELLTNTLLNEMKDIGLSFSINGTLDIISKDVMSDIGQLISLSGGSLSRGGFNRDALYAKLFDTDSKVTLIGKQIGGIKKIFSVRGGYYKRTNQSILLEIIESLENTLLGKLECMRYSISHFKTEIDLRIPKLINELGLGDCGIIPGIRIVTSDTGDSSLSIKGCWFINDSVSVIEEVNKSHRGEIDVEDLVRRFKEDVYKDYFSFPEKLLQLKSILMTKKSWDLTNKEDVLLNQSAIKNAINSIFEQIDLVKLVSLKYKKALFDAVSNDLKPNHSYNAYDITLSILKLSGTINCADGKKDVLCKTISKVPYVTRMGTVKIPNMTLVA